MKRREYLAMKDALEAKLVPAEAEVAEALARVTDRESIRDGIRKELDALEIVWAASQRLDAENLASTSSGESGGTATYERSKLYPHVRKAAEWFGDREFEIREIIASIAGVPELYDSNRKPKQSTVSGILSRLHEEGVITRIREGKGRRPARYRGTPRQGESPKGEGATGGATLTRVA